MNIHEYQAKAILAGHGVAVPKGVVAFSVNEAVAATGELGGSVWVVKAQIHAGGRGKAGGVRICKSPDEVKAAADDLLGKTLVTEQTGPAGKLVNRLYVEQGLNIEREFYLSLLVDREHKSISFMVSPDGGMDIEAVAAETPERILTLPIDVASGLMGYACRRMAFFLGLKDEQIKVFSALAASLYRAFQAKDASLLELNPLVLTKEGELLALDAKMVIDDNALYRQKSVVELRDESEEDAREAEAAAFGLNYISLDGDIGCMVNGAGLAMATMDIIQLKGEKPANFLDVGGGVTEETVTEGFRLLFSNRNLKAVLVNIFGGIVRCDIIAQGLINAVAEQKVDIPVILRLVGTREEDGKQMVRDAGLNVRWAHDLDEAAEFAAAAARGEL